ncbi:MAG: hypothetical protein GY858_06160, partial [Candidatus Omnitrophica bacterium]|nr:hypothetical protein [Candidatus Omnitrophota bacterium]
MTAEDRTKTIPSQPFSGTIPQFYGCPKIHKSGTLKIRPIVVNVDIYCDKLLMHIKGVLNLVFYSEYAVLNSYDFVERLDGLTVTSQDRLASLDVESLFTKVPVSETLQIVHRRLLRMKSTDEGKEELEEVTSLTTEAFMKLLQLMVEDFFFCYAKELYRQKAGLPMGSRLSPVLANIYMEEMETMVLELFPVQPKMYTRFVDDIFLLYDASKFHLEKFVGLFNAQHPNIRLTVEKENSKKELAYLDLLVKRVDQGDQRRESLDRKLEISSKNSEEIENLDECMDQTMDQCMDALKYGTSDIKRQGISKCKNVDETMDLEIVDNTVDGLEIEQTLGQINKELRTRPENVGRSSLRLSIHRKVTHCNKYLHFRSNNPISLKRNVFRGLSLRARRLLKNHPQSLQKELNYLNETFGNARNGYPQHLLQRWSGKLAREVKEKPDLLIFRKKERIGVQITEVQEENPQ